MKFGPCPVDGAVGAILAHSLSLPEGRLRKGVRLSETHVAALSAAGHDTVVVAQLDAGDMHEDAAALHVARALIPETKADARGLRLSEAFTGRVNLIADGPGVVCLSSAAIHAANAVDPAITIATVPPFHQIHPGGMVATVKVISYGVPEAAVIRAADALRGAVTLAQPVYATASLIVSEIPGGPGLKGVDAIENRLSGLGMTLAETVTCAHNREAMSEAMTAARGDVILILTGSATSDMNDTAPAALRLAGGQVERFGMPVDPGNLLFLGGLGDVPVIGLPGSARSPVLHGADWVLSRVACGLKVTSEDIAAMGVGGLLKEIPTRPQPRSGRRKT